MKRRVELQATELRRAWGFTLVELIIVIVIILLISVLVLPTVLGALADRKYSDATRTLHAVFLSARDRAIQSGNVVGVRLIREEIDPFEVTRLVYVTVPEPFSIGRVNVSGTTVTPDLNGPDGAPGTPDDWPDPHFEQVNPGKDATFNTFDDIRRVVPGQSSIRFDLSGKLYLITGVSAGSPASLTISTAPVAVAAAPAAHRYQIFGAPAPVAEADVILLPEGLIIDLRTPDLLLASTPGLPDRELLRLPRSRYIPNFFPSGLQMPAGSDGIWGNADDPPTPALPANWPPMDILFAPNGAATGLAARSPLIHIWLGERGDKGSIGVDSTGGTADDGLPNRPHKMLTLNTRTGLVLATDDPIPKGTLAKNFSEVYGRAEQSLGVSLLP